MKPRYCYEGRVVMPWSREGYRPTCIPASTAALATGHEKSFCPVLGSAAAWSAPI